MGSTLTNGDKPSSEFLSHLTSYPVVSDGISTFKSNPYGAKSIDIADAGFDKFVKPVLPYAQKPYGYVAPYVAKADSLANTGLGKVDATFPIVKEDTEKIKGTVLDYVFFPVKVASEGKDYLFGTYSSEYKKCGGDGLVSGGKAFITTGLVVTSDTLSWLSAFLGAKKEEAKPKIDEAKSYAKDKTGQ